MSDAMRELQKAADCAGLEMEFLELRKDAERYRWLREQCNTQTNLVQYLHDGAKYLYTCNSARDMDAAIDSAIAAQDDAKEQR